MPACTFRAVATFSAALVGFFGFLTAKHQGLAHASISGGEGFCGFDRLLGIDKFSSTDHWSETATDGPGRLQGRPMTLTWSIVPDGTSMENCLTSESSTEPSDIVASLDAIYGSGGGGADLTDRPWFAFFEQAFLLWGVETRGRVRLRARGRRVVRSM